MGLGICLGTFGVWLWSGRGSLPNLYGTQETLDLNLFSFLTPDLNKHECNTSCLKGFVEVSFSQQFHMRKIPEQPRSPVLDSGDPSYRAHGQTSLITTFSSGPWEQKTHSANLWRKDVLGVKLDQERRSSSWAS